MIIIAIQFASYDDKNMQSGKFYLVEVNTNDASNLRDITTITSPLNQATQDIIEIKGKNEAQDIEINSLKGYFDNYKETILDNQTRINNLEKTEIERISEFIDRVTITKPFVNATHIEIEHNRKIVTNVLIMKQIINTPTKKQYDYQIVPFSNIEELINGIWKKKIVINTAQPINGFVVIL